MGVTAWLLAGLLLVAAVLVVLAKIGEAGRVLDEITDVRPVRVRLAPHSQEDRPDLQTHRLIPPPPLRYGGVGNRRRAAFLGDDGEWIIDPYDR